MVSLRFLSLPFLLVAAVTALPACQVKYRRDVEAPGTPAKYTYSAGGFIRYDGYDDVAGDLEIASREYAKPGSNSKIRLVGVIHIGDIEYYRELQKDALDTSDVVLFEGVKFEGEDEGGKELEKPDLGGMYSALGNLLGIGFQKDGIDYTAQNFVHCDVTVGPGHPLFSQVDADQMKQASQMMQPLSMAKGMMAAMGEPRKIEDGIKHAMVTMMAMQMDGLTGDEAAEEAKELFGGKGNEGLEKRAQKAAEAFKKINPNMLPGMSPEMKEEILDKRNAYVVDALKTRLQKDGDAKKQTVAVFYGAAHMTGIEKDLAAMGYEPVETVWYKAWRMNGAGQPVLAERLQGKGEAQAASGATAQPKSGARKPGARKEPVLY